MRVKHWAGYGCVEAKKLNDYGTHVKVLVTGNHEMGLEPRYFDNRDWERWLGKRFHIDSFDRVEVTGTYVHDIEAMTVTFYREG